MSDAGRHATACVRIRSRPRERTRHQSFLASSDQHLIEQLHEGDIVIVMVFRTPHQSDGLGNGGLDDFNGVADKEGSEGSAHDDEHLSGMPEGEDLPSLQKEAADHGQQDDD